MRPSARRAVIIGSSRPDGPQLLRAEVARADLLICADGGLRAAASLGVWPQLVVGDFDSVSPALLARARAHGAQLLAFPPDKDKTDAELALEAAVARGVEEVTFAGVLGGRLDHTVANLALLLRARSRGVRARIVHGREQVLLAGPGRTVLPGRRGDAVSLLPVTASVRGVTLRGLRYPLVNGTIRRGSTLGVSNAVVSAPATVRVRAGVLLVVVTRRTSRP